MIQRDVEATKRVPQNTYNFRTDLKAFLQANPNCAKVLPAVLTGLRTADLIDTNANPQYLGQTVAQLGATIGVSVSEANKTLQAIADSGAFGLSNIDNKEVYFFDSYFKKSSAVARGQTVFHEGLHLYFRGDHQLILNRLGLPLVRLSYKEAVWGKYPDSGFPRIVGEVEKYFPDDTSAAEQINKWLAQGCRR